MSQATNLFRFCLTGFASTLLFLQSTLAETGNFPPHTTYEVCFTPQQDCTRIITNHISHAKKQILVQGYSFTSFKIANALIRAYKHGIDVQIILDKSQFTHPISKVVRKLMQNHIPLWSDYQTAIAHNKVMIFDQSTVETGSFNFTYSAQHYNAENVLFITDQTLAKAYLTNWQDRKNQSSRTKD